MRKRVGLLVALHITLSPSERYSLCPTPTLALLLGLTGILSATRAVWESLLLKCGFKLDNYARQKASCIEHQVGETYATSQNFRFPGILAYRIMDILKTSLIDDPMHWVILVQLTGTWWRIFRGQRVLPMIQITQDQSRSASRSFSSSTVDKNSLMLQGWWNTLERCSWSVELPPS